MEKQKVFRWQSDSAASIAASTRNDSSREERARRSKNEES